MPKKWIVVTTINPPGNAIDKISGLCANGWSAVVVGDTKTPQNWSAPNISFLSVSDQKDLFGKIAELIPYSHYCRKNLGYIYAICQGADVVLETDDDNIPYSTFGESLDITVNGYIVRRHGWVNIYKYFTDVPIWPRGLPLTKISSAPVLSETLVERRCPIQQYLADNDPDVDAIYRLVLNAPVFFQRRAPIIAGENTWVPFNSQNTAFFQEVFPLLYLPCHVSFRTTDIWRSFVAQAAIWNHKGALAFHSATVEQSRNEHDLMRDFSDEVPGYLGNERLVAALNDERLKLTSRHIPIADTAFELWRRLADEHIISSKELQLLEAWMSYIQSTPAGIAQ